jgi:uncharacterized protein YdeI (YjbR/CyaY-like superfamily)
LSKEAAPVTGLSISAGVVHALPGDLRARLVADPAARAAWEDITPLARNEWICWIESVKRAETRLKHLDRACADLKAGQRRPCCWPGCPHRQKGAGARGA